MTQKGNELELIGAVQPNASLNIPLKAVYTPTNELFFAVSGYSISSTPYAWKDLQTKLGVTKILQCTKTDQTGKELFIIKAVGEMEQVFYESTSRHTMASTCFNIRLRPAVIFKNFLPVDIVCCVDERSEEFTVNPGDTLQLPSVDPGKNVLVVRVSKLCDFNLTYLFNLPNLIDHMYLKKIVAIFFLNLYLFNKYFFTPSAV